MPRTHHFLLLTLSTLSALSLVKANLTPCGVICAGNMLQQGPQLNCNKTAAAISNIGCLCGTSNFNNGVNDCLRGVCGSVDSSGSSAATSWISSVCSSVGVTSITTTFNPSMITSTGSSSDPVTINILSSTTSSSVPSTTAPPLSVKKVKAKREITRRDQPTIIVTSTHTSSSVIATVQTTVTPLAEPAKLDLVSQLSGTDLTPCGAICIGNMLQKGSDMNCTDPKVLNNIGCLCSAQNFHYGINDCLRGACGSMDTSGSSIAAAWVTSICGSASVSSTVSPTSGSPVSITILPTSDTSPLSIAILPTTAAASSISGLDKQIASTTVSGSVSESSISMTTATISLTTEKVFTGTTLIPISSSQTNSGTPPPPPPTTTQQPATTKTTPTASQILTPIPGWDYVDCYTNPPSTPQLTAQSTNLPKMDLQSCMKYCRQNSQSQYQYAGVSNGTICSCGDSLTDKDGSKKLPIGSCDVACTGDSAQLCGGVEAVAVYFYTPLTKKMKMRAKLARRMKMRNQEREISSSSFDTNFIDERAAPAASAAASSSAYPTYPTLPITTSPLPTPTAPVPTPINTPLPNWTYVTCYGNPNFNHYPTTTTNTTTTNTTTTTTSPAQEQLNGPSQSSPSQNITTCINFCTNETNETNQDNEVNNEKPNYLYAGLKNGDTCYCGQEILDISMISPDPGNLCDLACEGDNSSNSSGDGLVERCGGREGMDVYVFTEPPPSAR